ncbi:MAG: hypothetical protein R3C18_08365 [Planctomycetaceae bacterium]
MNVPTWGIDLTTVPLRAATLEEEVRHISGSRSNFDEDRPFGLSCPLTMSLMQNYQSRGVNPKALLRSSTKDLEELAKLNKQTRNEVWGPIVYAHPPLWPTGALDELSGEIESALGQQARPVASPLAATVGWLVEQTQLTFPIDVMAMTTGMRGFVDLTQIKLTKTDRTVVLIPSWFHGCRETDFTSMQSDLLPERQCDVVLLASESAKRAWSECWSQRIPPPLRGVQEPRNWVSSGSCWLSRHFQDESLTHGLFDSLELKASVPVELGLICSAKDFSGPFWYRLRRSSPHELKYNGPVPQQLIVAAIPFEPSLQPVPLDWVPHSSWEKFGVSMMTRIRAKGDLPSNYAPNRDTLRIVLEDRAEEGAIWSHSAIRAHYVGTGAEI